MLPAALLLVLAQPVPGLEVRELLPGDAGTERLAVLTAHETAVVRLDASRPVLGVVLRGVVKLQDGAPATVLFGDDQRCGAAITLEAGAQLLVAQATAGHDPISGPPLKEKCQVKSTQVVALKAPDAYDFKLGDKGSVKFLGRNAFGYAGRLKFRAGADVAPHHHDAAELLWPLAGSGTLSLDGKQVEVKPGDAVRIATGHEHAFVAGKDGFEAIQLYLPSGPEERFRPIPAVATMPAVTDACSVDADCELFGYALEGPQLCCPSCGTTAGNTEWIAKVREWCPRRAESSTGCLPLPCGPIERGPRCMHRKCVVAGGASSRGSAEMRSLAAKANGAGRKFWVDDGRADCRDPKRSRPYHFEPAAGAKDGMIEELAKLCERVGPDRAMNVASWCCPQ